MRSFLSLAAAFVILALAQPARGALHTYVISEIFSSVDGKIQFIELREAQSAGGQCCFQSCGGFIESRTSGGALVATYNFTGDLANCDTGNTFILLATSRFALLPGAPTPDFIIPDNFLSPGSGRVMFSGNFVTETYSGLPTNGSNSLNFAFPTAVPTSAPNTPTNFAMGGMTGVTGAINAPGGKCCVGAACSITVEVACEGTWTSGGTCGTCTAPPANGRCCRGCTCAIITQANCTAPAGVGVQFAAAGAACNAAGVSNTPCCLADFDKSANVSIDDLFIYINLWLGNSPFTSIISNGGGPPTIDDLFVYINTWLSPGC